MITKDIKLHIRYRFNSLENIVATSSGVIYQLPYYDNRTKAFRIIKKVIVGGSVGYRINRKFYASSKIKRLAYSTDEFIKIGEEVIVPF